MRVPVVRMPQQVVACYWGRKELRGSGTCFGVNDSASGGEFPPKYEPDPGV